MLDWSGLHERLSVGWRERTGFVWGKCMEVEGRTDRQMDGRADGWMGGLMGGWEGAVLRSHGDEVIVTIAFPGVKCEALEMGLMQTLRRCQR